MTTQDFCLFCVASNTKYLKLIFYTFAGYIFGYMHIFSELFETQKYDFNLFKKQFMCHQISVPAIIRDVFVNINKYILVKYID
jgi:hypothetical protein